MSRHPAHAILDDRSLASVLFCLVPHGTLVAFRRTCKRWSSDTYSLAPDASRALVTLSIWPAALRKLCVAPTTQQSHEARMREWREQVLESLRMNCQDPALVGHANDDCVSGQSSVLGNTSSDLDVAQHSHAASARAGRLGDWFRDPVFRDVGTSDAAMHSALERAMPGDVSQLFLCSSRLSDKGVLKALGDEGEGLKKYRSHWSVLADICIVAPRRRCRGLRSSVQGASASQPSRGSSQTSASSLALTAGATVSGSIPKAGEAATSASGARPQWGALAVTSSYEARASRVTRGATNHGVAEVMERGNETWTPDSESLLTGEVLSELVKSNRPALRRLVLIGVPQVPLRGLVAICDLRLFVFHGSLSAACVEALAAWRNLETLKLSLEPRITWASFIRIFTECRQLRVADIYNATNVSDQLLGCAIMNLQHLEEFSSSCFGSEVGISHTLSDRLIEAFRTHFAGARKIVIDNIVADSFL